MSSLESDDPVKPTLSVNGCAVLIVDDIDVNRLVLEQLLRNSDAVIYSAESAEAAFQILDGAHVDVILMDLRMPKINGIEATRIIRAKSDPVLASTPIIAVSADVTPEQHEACRQAGVNDFLAKPVLHQDLVELLRRYKPASEEPAKEPDLEAGGQEQSVKADPVEQPQEPVEQIAENIGLVGRPANDIDHGAAISNENGQPKDEGDGWPDFESVALSNEAAEIPLLDQDVLDSLRSVIPPQRLIALLSSFRSASNDLLQELVDAVEAGSISRIRDHAHALKGTSSSVGLKRLAHLCFEVQSACDSDEEGEVYDSVAAIASAYNDSLDGLDNMVRLLEDESSNTQH